MVFDFALAIGIFTFGATVGALLTYAILADRSDTRPSLAVDNVETRARSFQ